MRQGVCVCVRQLDWWLRGQVIAHAVLTCWCRLPLILAAIIERRKGTVWLRALRLFRFRSCLDAACLRYLTIGDCLILAL